MKDAPSALKAHNSLQAAFGIFLPLITVNCTVLAVFLSMILREYSYLESMIFAVGVAVGWVLAIVLVAAIYEKLELVGDISKGLQDPGIIMVIAGIIALAFFGIRRHGEGLSMNFAPILVVSGIFTVLTILLVRYGKLPGSMCACAVDYG